MKKLDKRNSNTDDIVEFEGEQRRRLSSNSVSDRCSPLDLITNDKTKDDLLNELADIFIDSILWELEHGNEYQESGDLLPGLDKGTG
jgi:hypothetical protein